MANAGDRTRAYRLRAKVKKGEELDPADQLWLAEYEEKQAGTGHGSIGGSMSERIVNVEERFAAAGTGTAAEAAAAAAMAREEGRRIDYLLQAGLGALTKSFEMQVKMNELMMQRMETMTDVHLGILGTMREQYIARTQAEIDLMQAQEGNEVNELLGILMQRLAGGAAAPTLPAGDRMPRARKRR